MDDYSRYCFDKLKSHHPEYLKEIGLETEQDILALYNSRRITKSKEKLYICKFCNTENATKRSQQIRSIDEGETLVVYCKSCYKTYTE